MNCDWQAERARRLKVVHPDFFWRIVRTTHRQRHGDQTGAGEILVPDALGVRRVEADGVRQLEAGIAVAVSENGANVGVAQGMNGRVGVGRRIHEMRPVHKRCRSGIDCFESAEPGCDVKVLRAINRA
jgi:hypothetical protein